MKKLYFALAALLLSFSVYAESDGLWAYGNGTVGNPWLNGVANWQIDDSNQLFMRAWLNWEITYRNVPAGNDYEFKLHSVDGAAYELGYATLSPSQKEDFEEGEKGSIKFSLQQPKDVTISYEYDGCISVTFSAPTAVQEAKADASTNNVFKTIEHGQVILNYPDGTKRNMLGQPLQ